MNKRIEKHRILGKSPTHILIDEISTMLDSDGNPPMFVAGDRVNVGPINKDATVIRQILHYDGDESFWGNVELMFDDGVTGKAHCWQVYKLKKVSV